VSVPNLPCLDIIKFFDYDTAYWSTCYYYSIMTKIVEDSRPIIEQRVGFVLDTLQGVLEGYKKIKVSFKTLEI
jgi:hypothetical protein